MSAERAEINSSSLRAHKGASGGWEQGKGAVHTCIHRQTDTQARVARKLAPSATVQPKLEQSAQALEHQGNCGGYFKVVSMSLSPPPPSDKQSDRKTNRPEGLGCSHGSGRPPPPFIHPPPPAPPTFSGYKVSGAT